MILLFRKSLLGSSWSALVCMANTWCLAVGFSSCFLTKKKNDFQLPALASPAIQISSWIIGWKSMNLLGLTFQVALHNLTFSISVLCRLLHLNKPCVYANTASLFSLEKAPNFWKSDSDFLKIVYIIFIS